MLGSYVLPTLPFNTAEEHAAFRGTVTLRPTTVMLLMEEIVASLREQGFRKQVLTVGHGGSYWVAPFIKHVNAVHKDIVVVDAHCGGDAAWQAALAHAGLEGRNEIHGGAVARALALHLAPDSVQDGSFGAEVPEPWRELMDYCGWDRLTADGCWGRFAPGDAPAASAEAGRAVLEHFVAGRREWLRAHLAEACRVKGIAP